MKTKLGATLLGFSYMTLGLMPAYADDTDIFLGRVTADMVKPNILFILDNSGSMDFRVSGNSGPTRMESLRESMTSILNSVEGVNAGFMRFNAPGGSIMYPVADLDEPVDGYWKLQSVIEDSNDDAMQHDGTSSVILDGSELVLGGIPENLQTEFYDIAAGRDDAGQWRVCGFLNFNCRQTVTTSGNNIQLDEDRINGFRFQSVDIDPDADIYSAQLHLRSTQDGNGELDLHFKAENSSNSSQFTAGDPSQNISERSVTSSAARWTLDSWSNNRTYISPDLSALIREVIKETDWASDNPLTIIQSATGSGSRRVASFDGNSQAARLEIKYQNPGDSYASQHVGLRFNNMSIPQGATITNAYIEVTSSSSKSSEFPVALRIQVESDPNPEPFDGSSLAGRGTISPSVNWDAEDWEQDETVRTPSLIGPLQALVDDADWCGGNAVAFHITPNGTPDSSRTFYSADHGQGKAPRLVVEYDRNSVPENSCNQVVLRYAISGQPNDADESTSGNQGVNNSGNNLRLNSNRVVGLRFENLPVKQGAQVTDARVVFTAGNNDSDTARTTFTVQDSVAPPNFPQNNRNITNRTFRGESVTWDMEDWEQNRKYRSPDISSLVNPIVQAAGWNPEANAIVFRVDTNTGTRQARAVDWGIGGAAVLEIKVNVDDIEGGLSDGRTVRDHLVDLIGELKPNTNTPIVDSLYEAARYYRGDSVYWANERRSEPRIDNRRYLRVSHLDALVPGNWELDRPSNCTEGNLDSLNCRTEKITGSPVYQSPIVESCQANYIVLLTDGEANSNYSTNLIKDYIDHSGACQNSRSEEACSEELVEWMANNDMKDDVDGDNTVHTFTIAFAFDDPDSLDYLQGLAQKGGGRHFSAGSEAELTNAFNTIIGEILDRSATFVVPGTTVSQFNRLSHYEDIFFSVFKPSRNPRWAGNLKKYKISRTEANYGRIVGQQDKPAVDESTGFFMENVASYWSDVSNPDGPEVEKGGAAALLQSPDERTVVTWYEDATSTNLTANSNRLHPNNTNLTKDMLDIALSSDDYRESVLRWARGEDVFDENNDGSTDDIRLQFGDPLHSAPVSIAYGGTEEDPDFSIFFGTNDGFLRAIDGKTGEEHFAFIPEALLPNLKTLYENAVTDRHPYGVDGDITRWVHDGDGDPETSITEDGGFAYIYFGLRRGGNHYYALDVTDRSNPKLMWHINGNESPFDELGQTWSQPLKARVSVQEGSEVVVKDVLIFGGGYDPAQDDAPLRQVDGQGRAIFMVEAGPPASGTTPEVIWSAGLSNNHDLRLADMRYAIPSIVRAGDTNGDGLVNVMFAADMGGQIWRFDINNGQPVADLVTGGVIAELAEDDDAKEARRFYSGVDAATIAYRGERFIALTAGSGWRANPLNEIVEDRFYMIRQPVSKPAEYTKVTEAELYDATANHLGSDNADVVAEAREELADKAGWYIKLESKGEKVLATPVTAQATVYFTTYRPGVRSDPCSPAAGTPFFYGVNIIDATPTLFNNSGDLTRSLELRSGNIAPTPTFVVLPDGTPITLVGPEDMGQTLFGNPVHKTYWFEND